jgi:hypothetical protein
MSAMITETRRYVMKKYMAGICVIVLVFSLLTACVSAPGAEANVSDPASETSAAIGTTETPTPDAVISESPLPPAGIDRPLTEDDLILSSSGVHLPAAGEQYVLFIYGRDYSKYAAGAYGVCGDFMGRYFLDGESVKRYTPADAPCFYTKNGEYYDAGNPIPNDPKTLRELRTVVADTPLRDNLAPAR